MFLAFRACKCVFYFELTICVGLFTLQFKGFFYDLVKAIDIFLILFFFFFLLRLCFIFVIVTLDLFYDLINLFETILQIETFVLKL